MFVPEVKAGSNLRRTGSTARRPRKKDLLLRSREACCSILMARTSSSRPNTVDRSRNQAGYGGRRGHEKRRRRSRGLRLGRRQAAWRRSSSRMIVYEMHVRGFTQHPSSGVADHKRGTYAGLIEKIPYLAGAWRHGRRIVAGVSVRRARLSAGKRELLGLCPRVVLRSAPRITVRGRRRSGRSTNFATWSKRCTARGSK